MQVYPFPSRRAVTYAGRGMVATSNHLAAGVGLDMLKRGGNAVDAAIAMAAALTVLEPCSNGIGGDAFAIVWHKGKLYGLNATGPAPMLTSADAMRAKGYAAMPKLGWDAVTVPGVPSAWAALAQKFGKLALSELVEPAAEYAQRGHPVTPMVVSNYLAAAKTFSEVDNPVFRHWFEAFKPYKDGETAHYPDHAETLREIGRTNAESFYRGGLAERIDAFARQTGGLLRADDLAAFRPEWVQPLSANYRGYDVWELPPNGQGLIALSALSMLNGFELAHWDELAVHRQIECLKLAAVDGYAYITEPSHMPVPASHFITEDYAASRRALISETAIDPLPIDMPDSGTVYLCAADDDTMISYIQSNYNGYGSGVVVPGTGIALQNRASGFSLEPGHVNELKPGKRSFHTIIPGFLTKNGNPIGPFGVMGAFMQPQGHLQVLSQMLDFGQNPQSSLDAPRWLWENGKTVKVEPGFPSHMAASLMERGHELIPSYSVNSFGRGQIVFRDKKTGAFVGGTEPRADGAVMGW